VARRVELVADWLIVAAAIALAASLFLPWSELPRGALAAFGGTEPLGAPLGPTAWQVYSVADVLLGALAVTLVVGALAGRRRARLGLVMAGAVALAFVVHASGTPPTNGDGVYSSAGGAGVYLARLARSGSGETVATVALIAALAGLLVSLPLRAPKP
jgi:hypothetical protein